MKSSISSANRTTWLACTPDAILFMHTENNKGPRIIPCRTPDITGSPVSDKMLLKELD